jgi:hypothetical protein
LVKHLLNVRLVVGALAQAWFAYLPLMPGPWANWEDGPSRGAMAFIMFQPAVLSWLMMLIAGIGAVFTDAFEWAPVVHRGLRRLATLGVIVLILVTLGVCMAVALGASPAVTSPGGNSPINPILLIGAQIGGTIVPLIAMAWLAWLIDAPADRRHLALLRQPVLAILAITIAVGGVIGLPMLSEEIGIEREVAARDRQEANERDEAERAGLRALTDADPLERWIRYADRLSVADVQAGALRRLASRPTLQTDLAASLQSADLDEADGALRIAARIDFKPDAALEAPLRANFAALARRVVVTRNTAGDGLYDPTYLDRWFEDQLADTLTVTRKIAESAGVDLRDADRQLAQAIIDNYPTSKSAKSYPRSITALDRAVEEAVAKRKPH